MASAAAIQNAANVAKGTVSRFPWADSFPPSIDFDSRDELRRAILVLVVKSLKDDADAGEVTDTAVTQLINIAGNLGSLWDSKGKNEDLIRALIFSMMGPSTRSVGRQIRDWLLSNEPSWLTATEEQTLSGLRQGKGVQVSPKATPSSSGGKKEDLPSGFWKDAEDTLFEVLGSGAKATIRIVSYRGRPSTKVFTPGDAKWSQVRANLIADRMSGKLKRAAPEEIQEASTASARSSVSSSFSQKVQAVSRANELPQESPSTQAASSGMRPELKKGLIIGGTIFGVAMLGLALVYVFTPGESDVPQQP
jgi:hypothetical protein